MAQIDPFNGLPFDRGTWGGRMVSQKFLERLDDDFEGRHTVWSLDTDLLD